VSGEGLEGGTGDNLGGRPAARDGLAASGAIGAGGQLEDDTDAEFDPVELQDRLGDRSGRRRRGRGGRGGPGGDRGMGMGGPGGDRGMGTGDDARRRDRPAAPAVAARTALTLDALQGAMAPLLAEPARPAFLGTGAFGGPWSTRD
jgi:hypothetical protein